MRIITPRMLHEAPWEEIPLMQVFEIPETALEILVWTPEDDTHKRTLVCMATDDRAWILAKDRREAIVQVWRVKL